MLNKRTVEVIAFERERIVRQAVPMRCPVCQLNSELLTVCQAAQVAQVKPQSIYRWLESGKAHGVRTAGGGHRVCRHSLFYIAKSASLSDIKSFGSGSIR